MTFATIIFAMLFASACGGGDGETCRDADCESPPAALCDGDTRVTFAPFGNCDSAGACAYAETRQPCSGTCRDGVCASVTCVESECDAPPSPTCDGQTAVTYAANGVCEGNACTYPETRTRCRNGETCQDGACVTVPCRDADCVTPPDPTCDGDDAVTFQPEGVCQADNTCAYPTSRDECSARGLICDRGVCVDTSACADVVCDAPPADTCDGVIATTYAPVGACLPLDGTCAYTPTTRNCSLDGLGCQEGRCVEVDPCDGVVCEDPPMSSCEARVATRYELVGTCAGGACTYAPIVENCASDNAFCFQGACVPDDPCQGVVCNRPPPPTCDGDTRITSLPAGTCDAGVCSYEREEYPCDDDGLFCFSGACDSSDPCATVSCTSPPTNRCDANDAIAYPSEGLCAAGLCNYTPERVNCTADGQFCQAGACTDTDPCEGATCTDPPDAFCDGPLAVTFTGAATCSDGVCTYAETRRNCGAGGGVCEEGSCLYPDPCDDITCDAPPESVCDGRRALTFSAGTCDAGVCSYAPIEQDCATIPGGYCVGGACASTDPCFGRICDSLPAPRCDGRLALSFEELGVCTNGSCAYAPTVDDCATYVGGYCLDGACASTDPCFRVACEEPPAPACDGDNLVTYDIPGTCSAGTCLYTEDRRDCAAIEDGYCFDGRCRSLDVCFEIDCFVADLPTCDANTAVTYLDDGECTFGFCTFDEVRVDCDLTDEICSDGQCIPPDPCTGLACNNPPANLCTGNTLRFFVGGVCSGGICVYSEESIDCASLGGVCEAGACTIGDCAGVVCDAPGPPQCDGTSLLTFTNPGACIDGDCAYTRFREECATAPGRTCVDGACVEVDLCEGISCDLTPEPICDGGFAVTFVPDTGSCLFGECTYEEVRSECALTGQFCEAGTCVDQNPCDTLVCNDPPANDCAGPDARSFPAVGLCSDGSCTYPPTLTNCAADGRVCQSGVCVIDPTCAGITCATPPADTCDQRVAIAFSPVGTCIGSVCEYSQTRVNCALSGEYCAAGTCVPDDPCAGIVCTSPPHGTCSAGEVARSYETIGVCNGGECEYTEIVTDCAASDQLCLDGLCYSPDPCEGVSCDLIPSNTCDGNFVVAYGLPSTCVGGDCLFTETRNDCGATGQFCLAGACINDNPCDGVVCTSPPPAYCLGENVISFASPGTCSEGNCTYPLSSTDCTALDLLCFGGACLANDPCDEVECFVAPPATCIDVATASTPLAPGSCDAGLCSYGTREDECADLFIDFCNDDVAVSYIDRRCESGEGCVATRVEQNCTLNGGRCERGICELPCGPCPQSPPAQCNGSVAIRPGPPTTCGPDGCVVNTVVENCATIGQFCNAGFCVSDNPCAGVSCLDPPPPECVGGTTLRSYGGAGTCESGNCIFIGNDVECSASGRVCSAGACVEPSCDVVVCETPPLPFCQDGVAFRYESEGVCLDGVCAYAPIEEACADNGLFCSFGYCRPDDLCDVVFCDPGAPPLRACVSPTEVRIQTETGACTDGICELETSFETCTLGTTCEDGVCVP